MASIGFIGLGLMGTAMVRRLISQGHTIMVWNRTKEKSEKLREEGARVAQDLETLASSHNIILSMISTSEVLLEISGVISRSATKGTIHVDLSTVSPRTTDACERLFREAGNRFVHAPVLGSVSQVQEGNLLIFAGGEEGAVEEVTPILNGMATKIYPYPDAARASHMKLACNFFIACMITTLGEGLKFAQAAGLERSDLIDVLSNSALGAPMYTTKGQNIIRGNFAPRFFLEHMLKDVRLYKEAVSDLDIASRYASNLESAFQAAHDAGLGEEDYSSVVKII